MARSGFGIIVHIVMVQAVTLHGRPDGSRGSRLSLLGWG